MAKLNQSAKVLIGITVMLLTINIILGVVLYNQSSSALLLSIQKRILDVANIAASMIDGNVLDKIKNSDRKTEEYKTVLNTLKYFKNNSDISYIYCVRDSGGKKFSFLIDPAEEDPGEFGSPVVYTDALHKASLGTPAVDQTPYEDNWGQFYSAYSPVFTSDGNIAGIVVADFDAEWYEKQLFHLITTIITTFTVSLFICLLMIFISIKINRNRIHNIYEQLDTLTNNIKAILFEIDKVSEKKIGFLNIGIRDAFNSVHHDYTIRALKNSVQALSCKLEEKLVLIREWSQTDGLTSLKNKSAYRDAISVIDSKIGKNSNFSVAEFDICGLKKINDNYGHEHGDMMIVDTANILRHVFGADNIYRFGSDEFIGIFTDTTAAKLKELFHKFDESIAALNNTPQRRKAQLFVSKGCASFTIEIDKCYNDVLKRANKEMYDDKAKFYAARGERQKALSHCSAPAPDSAADAKIRSIR